MLTKIGSEDPLSVTKGLSEPVFGHTTPVDPSEHYEKDRLKAEFGDLLHPFEKVLPPEPFIDRSAYLHHQSFGMTYYFGCYVEKPSPYRARIALLRKADLHLTEHVLLETLEKKMAYHHGVVPGGVGMKPLERKSLVAKVLEVAVDAFVPSSTVIKDNDLLSLKSLLLAACYKEPVYFATEAEISHHGSLSLEAWQILLTAGGTIPGDDQAPVAFPVLAGKTKLLVLPEILLVPVKLPVPGGSEKLFDRGEEFGPADVAYPELFADLEDVLVEETSIKAEDDGDVLSEVFSNPLDHVADEVFDGITVVGVFVAAAEDGIDDEIFPVELKGLKAADLFVSGFDAFAPLGIVVIHNHGIQAEDDEVGIFKLEAPEEKPQEEVAEEEDPGEGEGIEEAFYGVGGGKFLGLDGEGVGGVVLEVVEEGEVSGGAVGKEAEELEEDGEDVEGLGIFADGAEKSLDNRGNMDVFDVFSKEVESGAGGKIFVGGLDLGDLECILFHISLHLLGDFNVFLKAKYTKRWRLFLYLKSHNLGEAIKYPWLPFSMFSCLRCAPLGHGG